MSAVNKNMHNGLVNYVKETVWRSMCVPKSVQLPIKYLVFKFTFVAVNSDYMG